MRMSSVKSLQTETIELPADVALMLKAQARAHRKPIATYMKEWLVEQAALRAEEKNLRAAIKANKGKPSIAAEDLYRECGI